MSDTEGVQTEENVKADEASSLLTDEGTTDTGTTDTGTTDTNNDAVADVAAAQTILDADDSSAEDKAAAQAIVDAAASNDAGNNNEDVAPDTYADFTMPEGVELDETVLADALPIFKELGLTQGQAQKVTDLYAKQVQAGSQKQSDKYNQLMNDWQTKSKNDSEFGGDKFEENVGIAQLALKKYGDPELEQLLKDHGVGNHPAMFRLMWNLGKPLKEDKPTNSGDAVSKAKDRVSILYPTN